MYKVNVTTLEKFRRYMADTSSYDTERALLDNLTGAFVGNDKTWFGSAFHKIIEYPGLLANSGQFIHVTDRGITVAVPRHIAIAAASYRQSHPQMVCEVAANKIYDTDRGQVKVSGRLDGMEGAINRDAKCRFRKPIVTDYMDSIQWKLYLDMTGSQALYYDVFEIMGFEFLAQLNEGNVLYPIATEQLLKIVAHDPIPCYAFPGMRNECSSLVNEFIEWVAFRNLWHLLKQETPLSQQRTIKLSRDLVIIGKQCPYCGRTPDYVDSAEIYGVSYGMIYCCRACNAWVGVHKGTKSSLGRLANAELRHLKIKAHAAFDSLWSGGLWSRTYAYQWLSQKMGLPLEETHIGMFDLEQCKKVIDACKAIPAAS